MSIWDWIPWSREGREHKAREAEAQERMRVVERRLRKGWPRRASESDSRLPHRESLADLSLRQELLEWRRLAVGQGRLV